MVINIHFLIAVQEYGDTACFLIKSILLKRFDFSSYSDYSSCHFTPNFPAKVILIEDGRSGFRD